MNPQAHRLIFNKSRNCMMAVCETAKSTSKGGASSSSKRSKSRRCTSFAEQKKSGLFAAGAGITIGKQQQSLGQQGSTSTAVGSTVGAIDGNVTITAGKQYTQVGSDVLAPGGDVNIKAQDVKIVEARETSSNASEQKAKQGGLTFSFSNPVVSALQGVQNAAHVAQAAGDTSSGRMQALAAASAALSLQNTAAQVAEIAKDPAAAASVGISISLGSSKSQSNSSSQNNTAQASNVQAGGSVNITATGAGENSNILVQGSNIQAGSQAGDAVNLNADNQVDLLASSNTSTSTSNNQSSGASIGVAFTVGAQSGLSFTASANKASGTGNGQDTTFNNTHVSGNTVNITSGGDTNLIGAVVAGNTVNTTVGGDLTIQSLQDTSTYTSQQSSSGGGVSVCVPPFCYGSSSASASAGKSNVNSNYASVNEQSGIQAGDGGFNVAVAGNTALVGGAISSTQAAVNAGLNSFTTGGTLTTSDIQNTAAYDANGYQIGASLSTQLGDQSSAQAQQAMQDQGMSTALIKQTANAQLSGSSSKPSGSAGIGSASGNAGSITASGISGIAGNTAVRTGSQETGIAPIFDQAQVQKDIDAQVQITAAFGSQASKAWGTYADNQANDQTKTAEERASGPKAAACAPLAMRP